MASPLIRGLFQYHSDREDRKPRPAKIDVAIIVPDMRTARRIKRSVAVITPKSWQGTAILHTLIASEDLDEDLRVFLASLRIFNPVDLDVVYPVEMELGWDQTTLPPTQAHSSSTPTE